MIERAIENWLTNTNERNYQTPFCQVLLHQGYRILYVSPHRSLEQGKDVITLDRMGECCCYQLKTGDIDIKKWRELSGEVKELIELPVVHPSVDKLKIHKSFLVTNGDITDEVRLQIDQINEDNKRKERKYSYLDVITGKALVKDFIDAQGGFIPTELADFELFLKLFLADGTDFLPKEQYFEFLNKICFSNLQGSRSHVINAISSSIILTAYALNPYQVKGNHYALFEAWTSLSACILRYAQKTGIKEKDWIDSYNLAMVEAVRNLSSLKEEMLTKTHFLEGEWRGDGAIVYKIRAGIVLGAMATLEIYYHASNKDYDRDSKVLGLIMKNIDTLFSWGDSAFPFLLAIIQYLELCGEKDTGALVLTKFFLGIVDKSSLKKEVGFPNIYYSASDVLEALVGVEGKKMDLNEFRGSSYVLGPMIMMLTRRDLRKILEDNWRKLTYIQLNEFRPDNAEDIFTWRVEEGVNYSEFPKMTQSWAELKKDACQNKGPDLYLKHLSLLRFFILVCPHRATNLVISLLDS